MRQTFSAESLPVLDALASSARMSIVHLLAERPMNISELAAALEMSSAAVTVHVRKLEDAGIVGSMTVPGRHGAQKVCSLLLDEVTIPLRSDSGGPMSHRVEMPVGHYVDWDVKPTCGLIGPDSVIGQFDDPRFFADPERTKARMLWFGTGFVAYRFPNYLLPSQEPIALEFTAELSSEAPGYNNDWPSDIHFSVNNVPVGSWTSPGDFGGRRGSYTPDWISEWVNQYGLLKILRIDGNGTTIDGTPISDVKLTDLGLEKKGADILLRLEAPDTAAHAGGLTVFGRGFGNYGRNLEMKLYYRLLTR